MRIYISGPISNTKDFKERFARAVKFLSTGYPTATIVNPAALNDVFTVKKDEVSHKEYMNLSFHLMEKCDFIYLLKGWETSAGCNQEYGYATAKDMTCLYETN